jgi:hypothetical protein
MEQSTAAKGCGTLLRCPSHLSGISLRCAGKPPLLDTGGFPRNDCERSGQFGIFKNDISKLAKQIALFKHVAPRLAVILRGSPKPRAIPGWALVESRVSDIV